MKMLCFARRNVKEILRDPLNLCFGILFPLVLLFLLSAIQANIPVKLFEIERLAPGIGVFGLSFITLFSATLISKDRGSSLFRRLYTTPLTPADFIFGYTLPIIPLAMAQQAICYISALALGLDFSANLIFATILSLPTSVLYISIGLLCGSLLNEKQVGSICGALLTNLSAWLSGIWFDLELVGKGFKNIAKSLPFYHSVQMQIAFVSGDFSGALPHMFLVIGYAVLFLAVAVTVFLRQMKKQ